MSTVLANKHRWLVPLLAGFLLAVTVLPSGSEPEAAAEPEASAEPAPRATRHRLTIPVADFHPADDGADYFNGGGDLLVNSGETAWFRAPVHFPHPLVTVKKVTFYGFDKGPRNICIQMFKARPHDASIAGMASVCSHGESPDLPRAFSDLSITFPRVPETRGPYLWLSMPAGTQYRFYGAYIYYTA
jgi:hypothetical protein